MGKRSSRAFWKRFWGVLAVACALAVVLLLLLLARWLFGPGSDEDEDIIEGALMLLRARPRPNVPVRKQSIAVNPCLRSLVAGPPSSSPTTT